MPISYQDNIKLGRTLPIDSRYGPYSKTASLTAKEVALSKVPVEVRYPGLTIGLVNDSNKVVEYWWPGTDLTPNGLKEKSSGVPSIAGTTSPNNIKVTTDVNTGEVTIDVGTNIQLVTNRQDTISVTPDPTNDNVKYPSVGAVKNYINDTVLNLFNDRGGYDPTATGNFPANGGSGTSGAIKKGDIWFIIKAGTIGTTAVVVGASVRALEDSPAQDSTKWSILDVGTGYVPENVAYKLNSPSDAGYTGIIDDEVQNKIYYPSINVVKSLIGSLSTTPTFDAVLGKAGTGDNPAAGQGINRNITLTTGSSSADNYISLEKTGDGEKNTIKRNSIKLEFSASQYVEYGNKTIKYTIGSNSDTLDFNSGANSNASRTFKFKSDLVAGTYIIATSNDLSSYLTTATASTTYQPLNPENLSRISLFSDADRGVLKKTGAATWSLDANNYLTDQNIAANTGLTWNYSGSRPTGGASLTNKFSIMYNTAIATSNGTRKSVTIGGITTPMEAADLAKLTIIELLDKILFSVVPPTTNTPTYTLAVTGTGIPASGNLIKVGTALTPSLKGTFSRGTSTKTGSTFAAASSGPYSGFAWKYEFTGHNGFTATRPTSPINTTDATLTQTAAYSSSFNAAVGNMTFTSRVYYNAGQKNWNSDGTEYGGAYPEGDMAATNVVYEGVYPIFATLYINGTINEVTTEAELTVLYSMINPPVIEITLAAEFSESTAKQRFYIPTVWGKTLSKIEVYNDLLFRWDTNNGAGDPYLDNGPTATNGYTTVPATNSRYIRLATTVTKTINGNSVLYREYRWNGIVQGNKKIRLTFT